MKYLFLTPIILLVSSCNVEEKLGLTEKTRIPVQNSNPANCPKWQSGESIEITQNTTIPKGCNYDKVSFILQTSNTTFDCNGSIFNGLGKTKRNSFLLAYKKSEVPVITAFTINGSENNFTQNITVKNCDLRYYVNGFNVSFGLNQSTRNNLKNKQNVEALENHLRTLSPQGIRIENTKITGSHKAGIFVQRYINGLTIDNVKIISAGTIGIYLESGTKNNTISNSMFTKNGETTYDIKNRIRKLRLRKREAIAVDSSSHNKIINNTFINNSGGAIFIYKNCYERYTEAVQLPRYQKSNFNLIQGNTFKGEPKGVWIASRQSRDLENFDCGDPVIHETAKGKKKYYEDFAKNTSILNNIFDQVEKSIIIEDDATTVSGNTFKGKTDDDIVIGTSIRSKYLNHPVTDTIIKDNIFNTNSTPHVSIKYDSKNTTFIGNTPHNPDK